MKFKYNDEKIIQLLGVQNFETDNSAILELIKNSYDANATKMIIKFESDKIFFQDNGKGMSKNEIENNWMTVGMSNKDYITDERVQAGDKGIGRLALARLGNKVELYSKTKSTGGIKWFTDGWSEASISDIELNSTGTTIIVYNFTPIWDDEKIIELNIYLNKIMNSVEGFEIEIINSIGVEPKKTKVENVFCNLSKSNFLSKIKFNYDSVKRLVYYEFIEYIFDEVEVKKIIPDYKSEIKGEIKFEFSDKNRKGIFQFNPKEWNSLLDVGDFDGEVYWGKSNTGETSRDRFKYRNTRYIKPLVIKNGLFNKEFKDNKYLKNLNQFEGIILYRNSFSVSGYDGSKDWLDIMKRVQKSPATETHPTGAYRLRNNNVFGKINIDKKNNSNLRDLSNRQGLENNIEFQLLKKIVHNVISTFEKRYQENARTLDNHYRKKMPSTKKIIRKISSSDELTKEDRKEAVRVFKLKEEENTNLKYDLSIHEAITTSVVKSQTLSHDINQTLKHLKTKPTLLREALENQKDNIKVSSKESHKNPFYLVDAIEIGCIKLLDMYDDILDVSSNEVSKKIYEQNLYEFFKDLKKYWNNSLKTLEFEIIGEETYLISRNSLSAIFDNLISNSINHNFPKNVSVYIRVECSENEISVIYKDNGIGLSDKYMNDAFEILKPFETSRNEGHGLGMWIVNSVVYRYGGKITKITGNDGFELKMYMSKGIDDE